jgi:membrane-associated phospholipid phosphatase
MEERTAKFLTAIFHPLLIPTYSFMILLHQQFYFARIIPVQTRWVLISVVFVSTFVIPAVLTVFMKKIGIIQSYEMDKREDRTFPYVITVVFFYLSYYLMKKVGISSLLQFFMAGATLLVVLTLIINVFWKISSHLVGIGGAAGSLIALSYMLYIDLTWWIVALFLIAGIVAYSRLRLNAHTALQVYMGFLLGAVVMSGFILFL